MAIKNVGDMNQILKNYDSNNWVKNTNRSREFGSPIDIDSAGFDGENVDAKSFGEFLTDSLAKVNKLQQEANVAVQELASGKSKNVAETLLTVEKAELAFKTMNQVRQKVIDAYREIMRMQI